MPILPDDFVKNNDNVGGVITEEFLNRFSTAHHDANHDIYHGTQVIKTFDPPLNIQYDVNNPIVFNLSPIPLEKFKPVWISHLKVKGASKLDNDDPVSTPPNVKISVTDVNFTFSAEDPDDPDLNFKVSFDWDLEGTCAIEMLDLGEGTKEIKLEPIKITISKHPNEVIKEISKAFEEIVQKKCKHPLVQNDDKEKLILYFTNQILALKMTSFIKEFPIPKAHELIKGRENISPDYLNITQKTLAVGAKVHPIDLSLPPDVGARMLIFCEDFKEKFDQEFREIQANDFLKWSPNNSSSFIWLKEKRKEFDDIVSQRIKASKKVGDYYPENVQIFINSKLFNDLAQSYLKYSKILEFTIPAPPIIYPTEISCGCSVTVDSGSGKVITGGVEAHANIAVKAWAKIGIKVPPVLGKWKWVGLGVKISPQPDFGIQVHPLFASNGIFVQGKLLTKSLTATIIGFPKWLQKLLDKYVNPTLTAIETCLTEQPLALLSYFLSLFYIKIIDYPTKGIPDTDIKIKPEDWRFNTTPTNSGPYLVLTADTQFN